MVDFTFATTIQTFFKDNLVITPDGAKRPLVLLSDETPSDDANGSIDSGTLRIIDERIDPQWINGSLEDQVIQQTWTYEYSITATTTKAEFIDVLEDMKEQANEQNNSSQPTFFLEVKPRQFPGARHAFAEIDIIVTKRVVDSST